MNSDQAQQVLVGDPERGELLLRARRHLSEYFERDLTHLTLESRFETAVPGLDSLKLFEMLLYLEDCFDVKFEESALSGLQTLGDLLRLIESHLAAQNAPASLQSRA